MPIQPRSTDQIYDQLRETLTGSIAKLTNFIDGTFNDLFITANAEQIREAEIKAVAAQLSGFPDYAGKELTQNDLDNLGISGVDPSEINPYMEDQHLDELAKLVGASRSPGSRASGTVTFQVSSDVVEIEEGTPVATERDGSNTQRQYLVDADEDGVIDQNSTATVSPESGTTEVTASIIAADIGSEYNVGSNTITFLPSQLPGVRSVTNTAEVTGGADEQTNASLREDIKNAVFETSGGGTRDGLKGSIESQSGVEIDVGIEEYYNSSPPYVEVIADVPPDSSAYTEVQAIMNDSRPLGLRHELVTPAVVSVGVKMDLLGDNIDTFSIREETIEYLTELSVGSSFSSSQLISRVLDVEPNITSVSSITSYISDIDGDRHTYTSGTTDYELSYAPLGKVIDERHLFRDGKQQYELVFQDVDNTTLDVEARIDRERQTLAAGTDYSVVDTTGDGSYDTIEFLDGGKTPDDRSTVIVSYEHDSWQITAVTSPDGSTTYTQGTDFSVVDSNSDGLSETIRWDTANTVPPDGDDFIVDYEPGVSFGTDLTATDREKLQADTNLIVIDEVTPE